MHIGLEVNLCMLNYKEGGKGGGHKNKTKELKLRNNIENPDYHKAKVDKKKREGRCLGYCSRHQEGQRSKTS